MWKKALKSNSTVLMFVCAGWEIHKELCSY